jgi:WD40 repeat protein
MDCPNGHGAMLRGRRSWVCEECGQRLPVQPADPPPGPAPPSDLVGLPGLLAIPLEEYAAEAHPVLRLHRLCDAVEILTRFCAVVALGEVRARLGDGPLPDDLLRNVQPQIERPTFGQWRDMLRALLGALGPGDSLVVPELPDFVAQDLLPHLQGGDLPAEQSLLTLRNDLAHGGGLTRAAARDLLTPWAPCLEGITHALSFLAGTRVCHVAGGVARGLPWPPGPAAEEPAGPADLPRALQDRRLEGHVVLIRRERWLDLWPLCDYGRAVAHSPQGPRTAAADSPLVYVRAQRARLLYAALGAELPLGERSDADTLRAFRDLFRLDARLPGRPAAPADFEAEIRADAAALVGRRQEVEHVKTLLRSAERGVFWVAGPAGIGKSFLLARVAHDLAGARDLCRIAWRFQAGDGARCRRDAFLRHAVERLGRRPGMSDVRPAVDPGELQRQLAGLLDEAAGRPAATAEARTPQVLFVLDGLDEIERLDPGFAEVPLQLQRPGVLWLCAGRPVGNLPQVYAADRCTHVFPGGLPAMSADDIRGMLIDGTGKLKYQLLPLDREETADEQRGQARPVVVNEAVAAVVRRAAGLPLYVRFVVEDLLAGHFRFGELEQRLPPGLDAYYDDLLRRLAVGELQALLTPLVVTLAWAQAPLDEDTLHLLMARRKVAAASAEGKVLVRRGLAAVQAMVRPAPREGGDGVGYEPYHLSFREHVRRDPGGVVGQQNALSRDELCVLGLDWAAIPGDHPAREYALRYGPRTLLGAGRGDDLVALLTDLAFLEAKAEAGLVFELAADFGAALAGLPAGHPRARHLRLLEESLRTDLHFLARHPRTLFQCLWNRAWWYDCSRAGEFYVAPPGGGPPGGMPWEQPGPKLSHLLEGWRADKEKRDPGFCWLRSLRPPPARLGTAQRALFSGHLGVVLCVALSPDGTRIASGSKDQTVRMWDVHHGTEHACLSGHEDAVLGVAFSPDGRWVASGSLDQSVRLWEASGGAARACLRGHNGGVHGVAFSPDGLLLVSCSRDGTLRLWDVATGKELARLTGHEAGVIGVAFTADGRRLVSGSVDRTVRLWDAATGRQLACLRGHEDDVTGVASGPGGVEVVSASADHTLRVWDAESGAVRTCLRGHGERVMGVAVSADGRRLVSASWDGTVRLWDPAGGDDWVPLRGHDDMVVRAVFSPDGSQVASCSRDGTLRLWDAAGATEQRCLRGHGKAVWSVAYSPDGTRLVSGSWDHTVRVWDVASGAERACLRGHGHRVRAVAWSPDGTRLASASDDKTVRVWDAVGGVELFCFEGHKAPVAAVAFSADGRQVASGSDDKTVRVWDAADGAERACLRGHTQRVLRVALSPDGRYLASASRDQTLRLWDAAQGTCLEVIRGSGDVAAVAAGAARFPWRALVRALESVVEEAATGRAVAWLPDMVFGLMTHPAGRCWAGVSGSHLYLFTLEGRPPD